MKLVEFEKVAKNWPPLLKEYYQQIQSLNVITITTSQCWTSSQASLTQKVQQINLNYNSLKSFLETKLSYLTHKEATNLDDDKLLEIFHAAYETLTGEKYNTRARTYSSMSIEAPVTSTEERKAPAKKR